jgi:hypothetical protein
MIRLFPLIVLVIISIMSCRKNKETPEPEHSVKKLFELKVMDSELWSPQNKLPAAANVEVEVYEMQLVRNYRGSWDDADTMKLFFTGKTNEKGLVDVIRKDTTMPDGICFFVKLKKGNRSNYSPEGYQCNGMYETEEDLLKYFVYIPGRKPKIGDKRLIDFNGDNALTGADKFNLGIRISSFHVGEVEVFEPCWLY